MPDEQAPEQPPVDQPPSEKETGRARLVQAARRTGSRGQLTVAVLLALLGFAAVTQVQSNGQDDRFVGARQGDLIQFINNLSLASQRAESEIARLERTRASLQDDTRSRRTALERAQQQASTLGILAGTLPAEGTGVRVTVTDTRGGVGSNQLLEGLEELRDAGAEAIELNDRVRVVAQTSLRDADGGVVVDGVLLRSPFVVDAIGGAETLAGGLDFRDGFIDEVDRVQGKVKVLQSDKVEITSVVQPTTPEYARPAPTG
jgi:uncharacterized protein YlxW (UPF0749 family)